MSAKPPLHPATPTGTVIRQLTLIIPPLLWCQGFLISSLFMGCSPTQAALKATAYTLSGFVGWLVYLLIARPSGRLYATIWVGMNVSLLGPTLVPRPFLELLAQGLFCSIFCGSLMGLLCRLLEVQKKGCPTGAHPLADAELDEPLAGN